MGRAATPIEVLKARGSDEQYRRKGEPEVLPAPPEIPPHVANDADAAELWEKMRVRLTGLRIWSEQFTEMLGVYCLAYADYLQASREAEGQPMTLLNDKGNAYSNPAWTQKRHAFADLMKIQREFACTPASKTQTRVVEGSEPQKGGLSKFGIIS